MWYGVKWSSENVHFKSIIKCFKEVKIYKCLHSYVHVIIWIRINHEPYSLLNCWVPSRMTWTHASCCQANVFEVLTPTLTYRKFCFQISYPAILFTMLIGFLNHRSLIVHSLLLGTSKAFTLSVFLPATQQNGDSHSYTGWPRKNATTLIVNFMNIVDETSVFYFYLVQHSFSNKMTPWSLVLGKVCGL